MANLTKVTYRFLTTGHGIDHNSGIKIELYESNNGNRRLISRGNFTGGGGEIHHECEIVSTISKDKLNGKHSYIEIQPVGHDKWQCDCDITFSFDDNTVSSFNHGNLRLGNHDGWGHFVDTSISGIE